MYLPLQQMLLGDRYGSRPLPASIPETEMQLILSKVDPGPNLVQLKEWYLKDSNAKPAEYVLQDITKNLPPKSQREKFSEEDLSDARGKWRKIDSMLKSTLRKSVTQCLADGSISKEKSEKYFWSGR